MDEGNNQDQQNPGEPHVRIFGADVSGGQTGNGSHSEDWRAQKENWQAKRQARKAEWRAKRQKMREQYGDRVYGGRIAHTGRGGGLFVGILLLFLGVVALLYTTGSIPPGFWQVIAPFWPIFLILWGASIVLGGNWFGRFIIFLLAVIFFFGVVIYGLIRAGSPVASDFPSGMVSQINNINQ